MSRATPHISTLLSDAPTHLCKNGRNNKRAVVRVAAVVAVVVAVVAVVAAGRCKGGDASAANTAATAKTTDSFASSCCWVAQKEKRTSMTQNHKNWYVLVVFCDVT